MGYFFNIGRKLNINDNFILIANKLYFNYKMDNLNCIIDDFISIVKIKHRFIVFAIYHKNKDGFRLVYNTKISEKAYYNMTFYELCNFYYDICLEILKAIDIFFKFKPEAFEIVKNSFWIKKDLKRIKNEKLRD